MQIFSNRDNKRVVIIEDVQIPLIKIKILIQFLFLRIRRI